MARRGRRTSRAPAGGSAGGSAGGPGRIQRSMLAGMLGLQAMVMFMTTPVLVVITDVPTGAGLAIGLGLCGACVVVAGMMRRPVGVRLGWAIQAATVAMGVLIPAMFVVGAVFVALYGGSVLLGRRVDRERAEREALG